MNPNQCNLNKFKIGDKVVSPYNNVYIIKSIQRVNGVWRYTMSSDGKGFDNMVFDEDSIKFYDPTPVKLKPLTEAELPSTCPICQGKWTKTVYGGFIWFDCIPCKDTAENLVERAKKTQPVQSNGFMRYY